MRAACSISGNPILLLLAVLALVAHCGLGAEEKEPAKASADPNGLETVKGGDHEGLMEPIATGKPAKIKKGDSVFAVPDPNNPGVSAIIAAPAASVKGPEGRRTLQKMIQDLIPGAPSLNRATSRQAGLQLDLPLALEDDDSDEDLDLDYILDGSGAVVPGFPQHGPQVMVLEEDPRDLGLEAPPRMIFSNPDLRALGGYPGGGLFPGFPGMVPPGFLAAPAPSPRRLAELLNALSDIQEEEDYNNGDEPIIIEMKPSSTTNKEAGKPSATTRKPGARTIMPSTGKPSSKDLPFHYEYEDDEPETSNGPSGAGGTSQKPTTSAATVDAFANALKNVMGNLFKQAFTTISPSSGRLVYEDEEGEEDDRPPADMTPPSCSILYSTMNESCPLQQRGSSESCAASTWKAVFVFNSEHIGLKEISFEQVGGNVNWKLSEPNVTGLVGDNVTATARGSCCVTKALLAVTDKYEMVTRCYIENGEQGVLTGSVSSSWGRPDLVFQGVMATLCILAAIGVAALWVYKRRNAAAQTKSPMDNESLLHQGGGSISHVTSGAANGGLVVEDRYESLP